MNASDASLPFNAASTFYFYGVDNHRFKLRDLSAMTNAREVYEAVEDPSDGYRSYLGTVKVADQKEGIFFRAPVDEVRVEFFDNLNDFDGFKLVSVLDGHVWLEVGTTHYDEYYPGFVFNYHPRA